MSPMPIVHFKAIFGNLVHVHTKLFFEGLNHMSLVMHFGTPLHVKCDGVHITKSCESGSNTWLNRIRRIICYSHVFNWWFKFLYIRGCWDNHHLLGSLFFFCTCFDTLVGSYGV